jgi:hypothetical protein
MYPLTTEGGSMARPSVFIGSSSEGLDIARNIRDQLKADAEITIWHEGNFGLGRGTLEDLVTALSKFNFAILVLTPDDMSESRDEKLPSPRDNVLFECGLFMGRLGRERTFIVYDADNAIKIPSDLAGIKLATYRGKRQDNNLLAAVGEAADEIRKAIKASARVPDRKFYTEYKLGEKHYRENLELWFQDNRSITGARVLSEGISQTIFAVKGFSGDGFYYLEYHAEDGSGGGAIVMRHLSAGKELGLIIAPNCGTGILRCYTNKWVLNGEIGSYDDQWLVKLGEVNEHGTVRSELSDLELGAQHIIHYLDHNNYTKVSFQRIRNNINSDYSDDFLMRMIDRFPNRFRRVIMKGQKHGVGKV